MAYAQQWKDFVLGMWDKFLCLAIWSYQVVYTLVKC
jgi:hypothetical protein